MGPSRRGHTILSAPIAGVTLLGASAWYPLGAPVSSDSRLTDRGNKRHASAKPCCRRSVACIADAGDGSGRQRIRIGVGLRTRRGSAEGIGIRVHAGCREGFRLWLRQRASGTGRGSEGLRLRLAAPAGGIATRRAQEVTPEPPSAPRQALGGQDGGAASSQPAANPWTTTVRSCQRQGSWRMLRSSANHDRVLAGTRHRGWAQCRN